ncbi:MAG: hypothetical protein B7Z73_04650 [Planctomycetia bacterium 21-64-5]|nr:MAG: hypothetical protein B7Z73_04650 [Planctomycetia bacterium 21-64-5]
MLRLMWKEYRVLRGFWLALAVFGVLVQLLVIEFATHAEETRGGLWVLAHLMPFCFVLGAAATVFAVEREEGTDGLLQYLPISSSRLFVGKLSTVFFATVLILVALSTIAIVASKPAQIAHNDTVQVLPGWTWATAYLMLLLHASAWGVLFSLRSARPLLATLLAAVATAACVWLTFMTAAGVRIPAMIWGFDRWRLTPPTEPFVVLFLLITAVLWFVNVRLAQTWLLGRMTPQRNLRERQSLLRRLVWQEWQRSRRMLAVLLALGLLLPLAAWGDPLVGVGVIPAVGLVLALLGSCTFLGDQEGSQFRFFAERGVPPRIVWRGRQLFWGGAAVVLATVLLIAHLLVVPLELVSISQSFASAWTRPLVLSWFAVDIWPPGSRWLVDWVAGVAGYFVWTAMAFGAGQFCSMFCRSGLVAAVFGVILAGLLLAWAALMQVLAIGWWWSVAPLAAGLFAATWLRSTRWILERRGLRALLPPVAALVVPALALLVAVPAYRVWEIPEMEIGNFEVHGPPAPGSEAIQAVRLFLNACEQLRPQRGAGLQALTDPGNEGPDPDVRTWLQENRGRVDAVVSALLRLPADAATGETTPSAASGWANTAESIIRYGQVAEGNGELDKAWKRYHAVLNFARLIRRRSGVLGEVLGDDMERAALSQLTRWGAREGQTVDRLKAAVGKLQRRDVPNEPLTDVLWREYQADLSWIEQIQARPDPWVLRWAPWEFTRARRLLRYETALNMTEAGAAELVLLGRVLGRVTPAVVSPRVDLARAQVLSQTTLFHPYLPTEGFVEARRWTLCYRRATLLALAAEWWRLGHDELPEKLSDLGEYFAPLPGDPYSNQPFEWLRWGLKASVRSENVATVPAGTPLIYSPGNHVTSAEDVRGTLDRLRRTSPDDPIHERRMRIGAGMAVPAAGAGGWPGMPMGGPAPPGAAAPLAPDNPDVYEPLQYIEGLAFPIPIATSEKGQQQPKEPE